MKKIIKSAAALFIINMFLKLSGPAKNVLIAHRFGISRKLDAYFIAQNIIDVVLATVTFAIVIIAIPIFSSMLFERNDRSSSKREIDSFLIQSFMLAGFLTLLFFIASKPLASIIPGFSDPSSRGYLYTQLAILSATLLFAIPASVMTGYFHSLGRVVMPSVLNALPVLSIILTIILLAAFLDIYSLPVGFLGGSLLVFLILAKVYVSSSGKFSWSIKYTKVWERSRHLVAPAMIFAAGGHINLLVDQLFTSQIKDGGVSILSYAQFFVTMPFMVITLPLITALFPEMSKTNTVQGTKPLLALTSRGFTVLFSLLIPVTVVLMSLKTPIIDLFYNHGLFDSDAAEETSRVLLAYGPAILFLSLNNLIQRLFFIKKALTILMSLTILSIALNIILDYLFASLFSITGIAIATSVTDLLYFAIITALAYRNFGFRFSPRIKSDLWKIGISGLIMGIGLQAFLLISPFKNGVSFSIQLLHLAACLSFGGLVYISTIKLLLKKGLFKYVSEEK
ncbi:murein biosynthesis integral membrane protein MurJ [Acidobacteriota bacterium]